MKIGINGFGRIGRLVLRSALARGVNLDVVAINDRGDSRSGIVDGLLTTILTQERMIHVVGWYDNEWGYASRVADVASFISECEQSGLRPERVQVVEREQVELALNSLWL